MNISAPFIKRPVATILLTAGVALAGAAAFMTLPVAPLPKIDFPAILVSAQLPGASPEVMAATIATPLERHLGAIADVDDMTSTSTVSSTNIQLIFGLDRSVDGAARDVQAAIVGAHQDLPTALTRNPRYQKFNSASFPILSLVMTSEVLTPGQIYDAADAVISQRISQLTGVGSVQVSGSALPAVRIEMNPLAMSKYGVSFADIQAAISSANANTPKGAIESGDLHYQIYTNDNARDAPAYRSLIIANRNGATVRLSDVAEVRDRDDGATENVRAYGIYNGKPAITVQVYQQPGANVVKVVDEVQAELPLLKAAIDPKIDMVVVQDSSISIRGSLRQVEQTLLLAVAFVILVVYLFINSARAALIPAMAVPVSLIGTFGAMYLLGFSLNNFSLMALTIATGFVVDDAIVVMENTLRHIEAGMGRLQAAFTGAREVGFTVISMSLSLVAVFVPFVLSAGILGSLLKEFTVTLSVSILISLAVSLTTTPMMCSLLLGRENKVRKPGLGSRLLERSLAAVRAGYERSLGWSLHHPRLMLASFLGTLALMVWLLAVVPKGFLPEQDTGQLMGGMRGDASASFQLMKDKLQRITAIIMQDPAVASVTGSVGSGSGQGVGALANLNIQLKARSQRDVSSQQVTDRLRPKFLSVTGVNTFLNAQQDAGSGGGGRSANAQYQYTLFGDDVSELRAWSQKLQQALQNVPEITDVDTDLQPGGLEADLTVDRDTAMRLGLTAAQVDGTLNGAYTQEVVSTILNPANPQQYHVIMEVAPPFWQNPKALENLYVSTSPLTVSGTQSTQAAAGTFSTQALTGAAAASHQAAIAADVARNANANSLATGGRGSNTGSPVSVIKETMVPFSAFSHFTSGTTPLSVTHTANQVSTSFAFNLADGVSLEQGMDAIQRTISNMHMPVSIHGESYGTARQFQQAQGNLLPSLAAALLVIYVMLGVLYESYRQPLTILSTLPSAGVGALLALMVTGTEFGVIPFIGFLLLMGLVKKNGIMLVDFALNAERTLGMDSRQAIAQACILRFRPIMMTTCAAIAGSLPLALSYGDGYELRRPLGISMVGGLVVSQLMTLYTTPVIYLYVQGFYRRLRRERRRAGASAQAGA